MLDEWKRSGEPLVDFARRHGFAPKRLYWWRWRLADKAVKLSNVSLVRAAVTMPATTAPIIVRLPNGIEIETTNTSPVWIAAVVNELTRPT